VTGAAKYITVNQPIGARVRATVKCATGEVVVGGGGEIEKSGPLLQEEGTGIALAVSKTAPPREWIVESTRTNTDQSGGDSGQIRAYAICANSPSASTGQ
jgi:hypothetical protein